MTTKTGILCQAFKYSIPVLLGYIAIGFAFGFLLVSNGYPAWLAFVMSVIMYAGAGQYIAVGLFASGASLTEAVLVQFVVNARHIAYGFSMFKRFKQSGIFKYYLIFALTDETFALLSSLSDTDPKHTMKERGKFMFFVSLLNQGYWVLGSVIGAVAGSLLPFNFDGIGFALTALFIVLMIEQIMRVRKAKLFIISAITAVLTVFVLPVRISLLSAMVISLVIVQLLDSSETV